MKLRLDPTTRRRGAATVEVAVLIPLLIALMLMGVDFARVYYFSTTVTNAARSGAIFASHHPDNVADQDGIKKHVLAETSNLGSDPEVKVETCTDPDGNPCVRVIVKWEFSTVVDYPGIPHKFMLTRSVVMRVRPTNPKEPTVVAG